MGCPYFPSCPRVSVLPNTYLSQNACLEAPVEMSAKYFSPRAAPPPVGVVAGAVVAATAVAVVVSVW